MFFMDLPALSNLFFELQLFAVPEQKVFISRLMWFSAAQRWLPGKNQTSGTG